MPKYHIDRSVTIDAPVEKVRSLTENFHEWPVWSPWLLMEPESEVNVYGEAGQPGHGYDWNGDLVGSGKMQTTSIGDGRHEMDLNFLKPFRSKAKVALHVTPIADNQSRAEWHMYGALPFFLFFMTKTMKAMIGMDYERGLRMLKEYAETGTVNTAVKIEGIFDTTATSYIGVDAECSLSEIGDSMKSTMTLANLTMTELGFTESSTAPGAVYHNVNIKTQQCRYSAIAPIASEGDPALLPATASFGSIEPCRAIKILHTGSYQHLGNAWSTGMSYQRYKKLKAHKTQAPFELYLDDPTTTPDSQLRTELYIPIKD
ncbi:hypothetical protein AB833_19080 [Chromatiales bacterium (ex Bugula neritina AB1)]|nr:hypothetical protein AB833_19080 [Chromatiales bacterium (ex Bugula neritina AB1)]